MNKAFFLIVLSIVPANSVMSKPQNGEKLFRDWDANDDGMLSIDELPQNAKGNFGRVEANKDSKISLAEHLASLGRKRVAEVPDYIRTVRNLNYAATENPRQTLDLFLPKSRKKTDALPIIVYIHGGGWKAGRKEGGLRRLEPFLRTGKFAAASINYRLSGEATWPAQIHDCKAAIRWIKGNAGKYGLNQNKMAAWGNSAGGHLAAMLGVSGGQKELAGDIGEFLQTNARLTCIISFCGPTHFLSMNKFPSNIDHDEANSPESRLIGGPLQKNKRLANFASPLSFVTKDDAPALIVHGKRDNLVPFNQAEIFHAALVKAGVSSEFLPMNDMGHNLSGPVVSKRTRDFLTRHLLAEN